MNLDIIPRGGDLWNTPLLHGCLNGCGAYVQPAGDGSIPAYCDGCLAAPEPEPALSLYWRNGAYILPPRGPETPVQALFRRGEQAQANDVRVQANAAYTQFRVTSQHETTVYRVTIRPEGGLRCTDEATGAAMHDHCAAGDCAHCGAVVLWLLAARGWAQQQIYSVPRNPACWYGDDLWTEIAAPRRADVQYVADAALSATSVAGKAA